ANLHVNSSEPRQHNHSQISFNIWGRGESTENKGVCWERAAKHKTATFKDTDWDEREDTKDGKEYNSVCVCVSFAKVDYNMQVKFLDILNIFSWKVAQIVRSGANPSLSR